MPDSRSRRRFLALFSGAAAALLVPHRAANASLHRFAGQQSSGRHPEPRPGIDASGVLAADRLGGDPELIELFDAIRRIPHIVDGIHCYCGCARFDGFRSLLICYEADGMARHCEICQGEGRLAHRRWQEGQSLDQIRRAIDARYGHVGHSPWQGGPRRRA